MEFKDRVKQLQTTFNQHCDDMSKEQFVGFTNKLFDMMINQEKSHEASFNLMYDFYIQKCDEVEK